MTADKNLERSYVQAILALGEESHGRLNAEIAKEEITEDCFTDGFLWAVFREARKISRESKVLSISSIASSLGESGWRPLSELWPVIPQASDINRLGQKLREFAVRRAAIRIAKEIIQEASREGDSFKEGLVKAAAAISRAHSQDGAGIEGGHDILLRFYDQLEDEGGRTRVIPTGIRSMDAAVQGLPRGFLSIIGAYPGCFKSGIIATIASNLAAVGKRVGIFSLEDNPVWVAKRYVSRATGIPVQDLSSRKLSPEERERVAGTQDGVAKIMANIFFRGGQNLTGFDVAAYARNMIYSHGCEVILIDHIGEIQSRERRPDRHDLEVAENVRAVRDVAKDTGVAVLMAAHLRRRLDGDEDIYRVPRMTDFSDSSSIEKMCRLALGLYQPRDAPNEVTIKVLKMNEGGARGSTFSLEKDEKSAMVRC